MRIYVASSWRNERQPAVVRELREAGHMAYDFRKPQPGESGRGFHWSDVDLHWQRWNMAAFRQNLGHQLAIDGFNADFNAMKWAEAGVLVMPCGRSAHLELGWMAGAGKLTAILLSDGEPELMYKMADYICISIPELVDILTNHERRRAGM